jgi:hypothetical protein
MVSIDKPIFCISSSISAEPKSDTGVRLIERHDGISVDPNFRIQTTNFLLNVIPDLIGNPLVAVNRDSVDSCFRRNDSMISLE